MVEIAKEATMGSRDDIDDVVASAALLAWEGSKKRSRRVGCLFHAFPPQC